MKTGNVMALVGAQYGSEGKGVIVNHIARHYNVHVRTGGPNAGHTFIHQGEKVVMQTIPCGWTNPNAFVVIGAGGLVDLDILKREIDLIAAIDSSIHNRLLIDSACGVISSWHQDEENGVNGEMHRRIGSTGKGVGAARRDRLMRSPGEFKRMMDMVKERPDTYPWLHGYLVTHTASLLQGWREAGMNILLEGTQGSGLSLIHGPWPYVTSADTNAAQFAADAGIPPQHINQVMLVARTYPIRVAGNSGPMERETSWQAISETMGRETVEKTTVTKKVRRIAEWDEDLIARACILNAPTVFAITFMDYLSPEDEGKTDPMMLSPKAQAFCEYVETRFGAPVGLVGTGGPEFALCQRRNGLWG